MTRRDAHPHNLTLAVGICEWTTAMEHIKVLCRMGQGPRQDVVDRLEFERMYFIRLWRTAVHEPFSEEEIPTIVAEARAYATEHQAEIDELLNREEVSK